jgi:hypothetical protein
MTASIDITHLPEAAAYIAALEVFEVAYAAMHSTNEYTFALCDARLDNATALVNDTRIQLRERLNAEYGRVMATALVDQITRKHERHTLANTYDPLPRMKLLDEERKREH